MKPPPRILLTSILALATLPVFGQPAQQTAPVHTFAIDADHFTLVDLLPPSTRPHVAGLAHPILDGPVIDRTTSKQE